MGHNKSNSRGIVVIKQYKPTQEIRKIPNNPPKFPPEGIRKRRASRVKSQQKKGNKVG